MRTIYLAGPINGCTDDEATGWRTQVNEHFGPMYERTNMGPRITRDRIALTRNPMDRDYRGVERTFTNEIVELDKRDIRDSDVVMVKWSKPSVGTSMEILYAFERDIPIIIWIEADVPRPLSPWLLYHASLFAYSFDEAVEMVGRFIK